MSPALSGEHGGTSRGPNALPRSRTGNLLQQPAGQSTVTGLWAAGWRTLRTSGSSSSGMGLYHISPSSSASLSSPKAQRCSAAEPVAFGRALAAPQPRMGRSGPAGDLAGAPRTLGEGSGLGDCGAWVTAPGVFLHVLSPSRRGARWVLWCSQLRFLETVMLFICGRCSGSSLAFGDLGSFLLRGATYTFSIRSAVRTGERGETNAQNIALLLAGQMKTYSIVSRSP